MFVVLFSACLFGKLNCHYMVFKINNQMGTIYTGCANLVTAIDTEISPLKQDIATSYAS